MAGRAEVSGLSFEPEEDDEETGTGTTEASEEGTVRSMRCEGGSPTDEDPWSSEGEGKRIIGHGSARGVPSALQRRSIRGWT